MNDTVDGPVLIHPMPSWYMCRYPQPIPEVEFRAPECPVCDDGQKLDYDAGWYCTKCSHQWNIDGLDGEYIGETEVDL